MVLPQDICTSCFVCLGDSLLPSPPGSIQSALPSHLVHLPRNPAWPFSRPDHPIKSSDHHSFFFHIRTCKRCSLTEEPLLLAPYCMHICQMQEAHKFFDVPLRERWDLTPLETGLSAMTCSDQENVAEIMFWELGAQVIGSSC